MPSLKPEVLEALAGHGLRPRPDTPLEKLRDQVRDLYLIEIRQLRDRCRAGEFPVRELSARVIELRKKYPILSIRLDQWELP